MVSIGAMRWRIAVQASSTHPTTKAVTWTTVATTWASVATKAVGETLDSGAVVSRVDYSFTLRKRDDITPAMRVVWAGKTLVIATVRVVDPSFIEIVAREKA